MILLLLPNTIRGIRRLIAWYILFIFITGWPSKVLSADGEKHTNSRTFTFYIAQVAWHTGIVLDISTLPDSLFSTLKPLDRNRYVDIGWGDEAFYQEPGTNILLALRAVLWPTRAALRVYGFWNEPVQHYGSYGSLYQLNVSEEQYIRLIQYISESFVVSTEGNAVASQRRVGSQYFFLAVQRYHLFRTCNTWVARALRESDLNVRVCCVLTRRQLARQVRKVGGIKVQL